MDKLNEYKLKILNEIPYLDIKPYSHNIISLTLQMIEDDYGVEVVRGIIKDFKLDEKGWGYILEAGVL